MPNHNNKFNTDNAQSTIPHITCYLPSRIPIPSHLHHALDQPIHTTWNQFIAHILQATYYCPFPTSWENFSTILLALGINPRQSETYIAQIQQGTYQDLIDHSDFIVEGLEIVNTTNQIS